MAKLVSCYACNGSGSTYSTYNLGLPSECLACNSTGLVSKEFRKFQIVNLEENNLVAIEKIHEMEIT